jgi:hypothetical protein
VQADLIGHLQLGQVALFTQRDQTCSDAHGTHHLNRIAHDVTSSYLLGVTRIP